MNQFMYPCTECSGDAFLGYSARKKSGWGGAVKKGERLCTACFRKRTGFDMFSRASLDKTGPNAGAALHGRRVK
jgi:hypothetical protein